jgi:chromosome segregation ATPase
LGLSADSVQSIIATGKSRAEALNEELAKLLHKDISKVRKAAKDSLAQRTLDDEAAKARREYESSEKKRATKEQTVIETEARIKALEAPLQQKDYLSTGSNTTLDQKIGNLLSRVQALETQLR